MFIDQSDLMALLIVILGLFTSTLIFLIAKHYELKAITSQLRAKVILLSTNCNNELLTEIDKL